MDDNPTVDPNNLESLQGFSEELQRKIKQRINCMLPVLVISHNRGDNTVTVKPQIKMVTSTDNVSRGTLFNIPVMRFGDANFQISFEIPAGSFGWVHVLDRDISNFLLSMQESVPNNELFLDFTNSVFIPDSIEKFPIDAIDDRALVIHDKANIVKITLSDSSVTIKAPNITMDGNVAVNGNLTNNSVNVGSTHNHTYSPGNNPPANSGPPK